MDNILCLGASVARRPARREGMPARASRNWDAVIWLILVFGYFEFFAAINLVLDLKTNPSKFAAVGVIYAVPRS